MPSTVNLTSFSKFLSLVLLRARRPEASSCRPPDILYHGTATRFLPSIGQSGLKAGARTHVHLSPDAVTARKVGERHGKPVVLVVDAGRMHRDGHVFRVSQNGVWLVAAVPPDYIRFPAPAA